MDGTTWSALALTLGSALATLRQPALARLATISLEYLHGRLQHDLEMRRLTADPSSAPPAGGRGSPVTAAAGAARTSGTSTGPANSSAEPAGPTDGLT
jgi:hypothetical protein